MSASALVLGLAACSGDSDADATEAPTAQESTSEAETTESATEEPAESETSADAEAPADGDATQQFLDAMAQGLEAMTTASMTMDMTIDGAATMSSTGQVDYTTDPPASTMTMTMAGQEIKTLMVGGMTYINMGAATQDMWAEVDPATMGLDAAATDPLAQVRMLEQAVTSAELVGTEDVNGASADHWSVTLDPAAMGAATEGMEMGAITYDIWLDGEGRTVKMDMVMDVQGQSTQTAMTMGDFDAPVTIEAPAADQITTMPGMG